MYEQGTPSGACMITEQGDLGLGATPINEAAEMPKEDSKKDSGRIDSE